MSKIINLTKGYQTIVDDEDYELLSQYKWYALVTKWGVYAVHDSRKRKGGGEIYLMHRKITNCPKEKVVDHINHDTLDNTQMNLRICTQSQNLANTRGKEYNYKNPTSKHKGVFFSKSHNKFRTRIMINGKMNELGLYATEEEAAAIYNNAAKNLLGEFAYVGRVAS